MQRKQMAEWTVRDGSASIASACRALSISETCYRHRPKLGEDNELIADWLVALTTAKKAWGFGPALCASAEREGGQLEPLARLAAD